jgi:hypothetical protein
MNSAGADPTGFSAADLRRRMAVGEAAKAAEEAKRVEEEQARQKAIIEELHKPPTRTPDQIMALVTQIVHKAAERGESEAQVYQFPSAYARIAAAPSTITRPIGTRPCRAARNSPTNFGSST